MQRGTIVDNSDNMYYSEQKLNRHLTPTNSQPGSAGTL